MTRRTLLASALLASCSRRLAKRYSGWLLVASAAERGIAVADLARFRHVTTIAVDQAPSQVLLAGRKVFVTCPAAHHLIEIDPERLKISGKLTLRGIIVAVAAMPGGESATPLLIAITAEPATICVIDPISLQLKKQTHLPETPVGMDLFPGMAAIAAAPGDSIVRVSLPDCRIVGSTATGGKCGVVRFRKDGKTILAGLPDAKQILTVDVATGALLARLPVALAPERFSFTADGGQMFVTGASEDAIVIVSPYQNEVDQTIVAGRSPYAMAVSATGNLLVTNPGSGDLTILDIDSRKLLASVHMGGSPGEVLLTPDGEYALVIGREAGDVSVVRMRTVLDPSVKTKPLFTVFPTGARPQSAVIVPREE